MGFRLRLQGLGAFWEYVQARVLGFGLGDKE